ncbi:glycosyltransferase family 39 protein [uncultured Microscilla sp.]|uniref:ArnT family glycosyltransferase n=1 Tax=uncultured Microscilla sp. TaxID=432653 RepID=UPI002603DA58|nr:glycosyltransferase family 39 protein [uncultured Microscilla sp.]
MNSKTISWLIAVGAALLFIPMLGVTHLFDWDEINFAESAREMLVTGNYAQVQVDFKPFWEKPPLFFWIQALSMKIFGVNEFAARFPNALIGIITLALIYHIGTNIYNSRFGLWWVLVYAGSLLPHFYFKSGIIDPLFNLFIFLGVYQLYLLSLRKNASKRYQKAALAGIFIGLGILTKGPVAMLLSGLTLITYWVLSRKWSTFKIPELLVFGLVALVVSFAWFLPETLHNGFWFISEFVKYQLDLASSTSTGHEQPIFYHPVVLLLGCFPASIYFLRSFQRNNEDTEEQRRFKLWMKTLFWVVLTVFSLITTKIMHYSSMCYFPLTFMAATYIFHIEQQRFRFARWLGIFIGLIGTVVALLLAALPILINYKEKFIPLIKDKFAVANLDAVVHWSGLESAIGFLLLGVVITTLVYWNRKNPVLGAKALFVTTLLTVQVIIYVFIPKVEKYTQAAAIEFMKSKQNEDCYVGTIGYKSYAQYFYTARTPQKSPKQNTEEWYLTGKSDKTVYLVSRIDRTQRLDELIKAGHPIKKIGEKNGFVFFRREASLNK